MTIGPRSTARLFRERLPAEVDGVAAAGWLRGEPRAVALSGAWLAGATILTSHPLLWATPVDDPFATLDSLPFELGPGDPGGGDVAVGGGWFGWLGFGLARRVEPVPPSPPRPMVLPLFDLAFHDHVVLRDRDGTWWFEALWSEARAAVLEERLGTWRARLASRAPTVQSFAAAPLVPVGAGLTGHQAVVSETVERIAAGELSQANLCLRLEAAFEGDPLDLWRTASDAGRPAYSAYVAGNASEHAVASLSPELFLKRVGRHVLTRPIKGTAPIGSDPEALVSSHKDRAENVMIVDLMRNDLGRVCEYGSVAVDELCALRTAPGVWQLESTVSGQLRPEVSDSRLLRATFPPGSVTGAPKVQALRTIHELESSAREAYCGAVGLCSPVAGLELNVAIRTLELARGRLWLGVGGGIVSDSSPPAEVTEALTKARGVSGAAGLRLETARAAPTPIPGPFSRADRPDPAAGLIETIRICAGRAVHGRDHLARLTASCAELSLSLAEDLAARIAATAAELGDGGLQVSVSSMGTRLATRPLPRPAVMELFPIILPGGLGRHKWADRGLIESHSTAGRTPLICDCDGSVLEAGFASVLLVMGDRLLVPPLDARLLPSVSRERVLSAAASAGWEIELGRITLAEVRRADAIVLSSSLRDPHPARLTGRSLPEHATELCRALVPGGASADAQASTCGAAPGCSD